MALTDPISLAYLFAAFVAYKIFWAFFGEAILVRLYPSHYAVWVGTEAPATTGYLQQLQFFWRLINKEFDLFDDLIAPGFERDGTTVRRTGVINIMTIDPQNVQAMLATQLKDFETGKLRRDSLYPILGDSIFTSDGAFWEHSRALFRPQFARDNINDLAATDHAADALIAACGYTDANGWTDEVKLSPLFFNFTLDTATDFLFGESLNSQDVAIKQARKEYTAVGNNSASVTNSDQFLSSLEIINSTVLSRFRAGNLNWLVHPKKFRDACDFIRTWTENYAQLALNSDKVTAAKKEGSGGGKSNVLNTLATQCKDVSELRNQTLAILFAGRDTTASLLGWMFMRLSLRPDIYEKLRKIVLAEFAQGDEITFAGLKSCRYLQHVINETLRLHPTVPFNIRVATKDTTLPTGGGPDRKAPIKVRKGELVSFVVYSMHRRTDLWGEDALEFKPERWERRIPAWQYLPFLGGARICLGQQFAITEASYVLVRLCQHFDKIEPIDWTEMSKMRKSIGVTMSVKDGVRVRLHKADTAV